MGVMHIPGHTGQKPREVSLDEISSVMGDCRACQLCQTRTNIVFGVGNPRARVMFVGEAPGKNEDLQGEPFVGRAGENLNRILSLAGLEREDIYIANVLKCRPPQNRNPQADEVLACSPYLREQIRSIWPDVIVTLGNPASHFVLIILECSTLNNGYHSGFAIFWYITCLYTFCLFFHFLSPFI